MSLERPGPATPRALLGSDPFVTHDPFQRVQAWQTAQVVPEAFPGALCAEPGRDRRQAAAAAT